MTAPTAAEIARAVQALELVNEWRSLRMEFKALTASVMERYADLGRPPGFSAWNKDEQTRHLELLGQMLSKLNALESLDFDARTILAALAAAEADRASAVQAEREACLSLVATIRVALSGEQVAERRAVIAAIRSRGTVRPTDSERKDGDDE